MFAKTMAPLVGIEVPAAIIEDAARTLKRALRTMNDWLVDGRYVAGTAMPTVADLSLVTELVTLDAIGVDLTPYPNVLDWRGRMEKVPYFDEVHAAWHKILPRLRARM